MAKPTKPHKNYDRTMAGLREALFDELEDLREGHSSPHEAIAFSKLADNIIGSLDIEIKQQALAETKLRRQLDARRFIGRMIEVQKPDEGNDNKNAKNVEK